MGPAIVAAGRGVPVGPGHLAAARVPPGGAGRHAGVGDTIGVEIADTGDRADLVAEHVAGTDLQPALGLLHGVVQLVVREDVVRHEHAVGLEMRPAPQLDGVVALVQKGVAVDVERVAGVAAIVVDEVAGVRAVGVGLVRVM